MSTFNRRNFLKTSLMGGVAATLIRPFDIYTMPGQVESRLPQVALTTGGNRADLAFRALQPFSKQISKAVGNKRVILKPNNVSTTVALSATHADTLEGVLEFFKSIGKTGNLIIAESAGHGSAMEAFDNFGYQKVASKYQVKLTDLDEEPFDMIYVFDEKDFRPHPVRISRPLLSPDSYVVSVARLKTHDRAVATLSLKNIVFGAPLKDLGFSRFGAGKKEAISDKPKVHGSGFRGINFNLYSLAKQLGPDLAVIDGFEGMEGNGPVGGSPVDHKVCVASTNWFAADRVGVELMGIDFAKVGYLNYCSQTGFGTADLNTIEIIGEDVKNHIKTYKLHDNISNQLVWMNPVT